jgi:hypothetical protein
MSPNPSSVKIFDLDDVVAERITLLHPDQLSLFRAVDAHFKYLAARTAPTP